MTNLPMIPKPGTAITIEVIAALEAKVSAAIASIDDVDTLQEWRAQAAALEAYLRGKDLNGPMLAAQRKVEARIGQLLGKAESGRPAAGKNVPCSEHFTRTDMVRFRILARGLDQGLPDADWRSAREPLMKLIQEKYPMPRHTPTIVTETGQVRKPPTERAKEIRTRAEQGMRAVQIAKDLGLSEDRVRVIAGQEGIKLPDAAMGKRARLDATRILTETVNGIDAYMSSLSMLDDVELPELEPQLAGELMQALSRSINGLRKLRIKMEKAYARNNATAA